MTRTAFPLMAAVTLAGCTAANASAYDSGNSVHCITIFGVTSAAAGTGQLADELNARILFIARSNGGEAWLGDITPVARQLGARWEASADRNEMMDLFDACRARQDADPEFRESRAALLREGRRTRRN